MKRSFEKQDEGHQGYEDIISKKYSSAQMRAIFSERNTARHWRKCWIALAEAEHELGLKAITKDMIVEMKKNLENIDLSVANAKEQETRHDVMAHIYAYGLVCPMAKPIIHLGATSQAVKCNTDIMLQREALKIIKQKLDTLLEQFAIQIKKYAAMPTLAYTHYQPAQPTTIGRRLCTYAQDFMTDHDALRALLPAIKLRGVKGTTGTQDSFMKLFKSDAKVDKLDMLFAKKLGFSAVYPITTQVYSRKQDIDIAKLLADIAASAKKFATDLRLLANLKIMEEPFEQKQVGSSAMPYKRNPMYAERICSLSRKVINNLPDFYTTYAEQWLERTLDDSALRRIDIPENFMITEYILDLMIYIVSGLVVYEKQSLKLLAQELPFMTSEEIMMHAVAKGGDRQKIHEIIRRHAQEVGMNVKNGFANDLLVRLSKEKEIGMTLQELQALLDPQRHIGRSLHQAIAFGKLLQHSLQH